MLHVCDWLPTLYVRAGGNINDLKNLNGYDVWDAIANDADSPRIDILLNIDPISGAAAYRRRNWKLVVNHSKSSKVLNRILQKSWISEILAMDWAAGEPFFN